MPKREPRYSPGGQKLTYAATSSLFLETVMLFLAFIFKRGTGYGDHAILRSLITLQDPRRNLYAPIVNEGTGSGS